MIRTTCKLDFGNSVARCGLCERVPVKNVLVERRRDDERFPLAPIRFCEKCVRELVAALHSVPVLASRGGAR